MVSLNSLFTPGNFLSFFKKSPRFILCLTILLIAPGLSGQSQVEQPEVYTSFDQLIGEQNMNLFNAPLYIEPFDHSPFSHPFFLEDQFITGHLVFDGQPYYDQSLRYNTFLDELIITPKHSTSGLEVMLLKEKVKEFSIRDHLFIRLEFSEPDENPGFLEVISSKKEGMLLKKHRKKKNRAQHEDVIISEYSDDIDYYIYVSGALTRANTKSQWKNTFPDQKKEINRLYRDLRKTLKTDKDSFFNLLFLELN